MGKRLAIFFDIGDTLASPVVVGGQLSRLEVYPFVPDILDRMRAAGGDRVPVGLGLISNTGDAPAAALNDLLIESGLLPHVDAGLCLFSSVEGLDKTQPALFARAQDRAAVPAARCVYVGEDAAERAVAASVGFRVSPHPLHALHVVETELSARPTSDHTRGIP
jgi:FMN phosphatase YigB (HAD superfamily)